MDIEQWAESKRAEFAERRTRLQHKRAGLEGELHDVDEALDQIETKHNLLDELLKDALDQTTGNGSQPAAATQEHGGRLPPTKAVNELIKAEPGIFRKDLLSRLSKVVASGSPDPSGVLSAAVSRGKKIKKFYESDLGRLWLYAHEEALRQREGVTQASLEDV